MISLFVQWYDRKEDMTPDYDHVHYTNIHGENPADCMYQLRVIKDNHDLARFTRIEIVSVY